MQGFFVIASNCHRFTGDVIKHRIVAFVCIGITSLLMDNGTIPSRQDTVPTFPAALPPHAATEEGPHLCKSKYADKLCMQHLHVHSRKLT